jgi:hypothetical protein
MNYLFRINDTESPCYGEEFIVNEASLSSAVNTAYMITQNCKYICQLTDIEAEQSGLDVY